MSSTLIRKIVGGLATAIGAALTVLAAEGYITMNAAILGVLVQLCGTVGGWMAPQPGAPAVKKELP